MKQLGELRNVGKAVLRDLAILEIKTVDDLASQDATHLFRELERRTAKRHDPCMWDVLAAIIHQAKTGEATNWWAWTSQRKALENSGELTHVH